MHSRSSLVTSFLNRVELVYTLPSSPVKVHSKLISSKIIDGLMVFSRAKLISIGSIIFDEKNKLSKVG